MKVSFVLQPDDDVEDTLRWACRQIGKIYRENAPVWVKGDDAELTAMNALLWTFSQSSFIPHLQLYDGDVIPESHVGITPVILSQAIPDGFIPGIIVNLSSDIYIENEKVAEIVELISNLPELKNAGRNKFKAYRQAGLDPKMQTL